jgi:CheY-like chemotaxis protein
VPDIVLLDINMPKVNGYEALERMKKELRLQSLPVILLTTSHREEDVVHSYANGACSFTSPQPWTSLETASNSLSITGQAFREFL